MTDHDHRRQQAASESPAPADSTTGSDIASPRAPDPVLTVEGVGHSFDDLHVLEDVTFALEPGTVTAMVGPNGCGKTTLLRIVAGLLTPTVGTVVGPEGDRPLGYLPQRPDFRPTFTVRETLRFYADLLPGTSDVEDALETVGLNQVPDRRVEELSGGMRRLLGLAQATLGDPPLVLLDEPTGDLDPRMTEYMFDIIEDREDDAAVLLATHNLTGAAAADRLLVLDRGRVVAHESPAVIVEQTDQYTLPDAFLELVGSTPSVGGGVEGER